MSHVRFHCKPTCTVLPCVSYMYAIYPRYEFLYRTSLCPSQLLMMQLGRATVVTRFASGVRANAGNEGKERDRNRFHVDTATVSMSTHQETT